MLSFFLGNLWLGTTAVQIQQITVDFTLLPENYLFATIKSSEPLDDAVL